MSHPFNEHRSHKVDRARVGRIASHEPMMHPHTAKYRAAGGHVDEAEDKKTVKKMVKKGCMRADGGAVKARADKAVRRAKGGKVHHGKGKTNVNVIVAPGHGAGGPQMPAPPMAGAAPPMPPRPPMAAPPPPVAGMGPPPVPAAGPGGMPPRGMGGRAYKYGGATLEKGGRHKPPPVAKVKGDWVEADGKGIAKGTNSLGPNRKMGGKVEKVWGFSDMSAAHPESNEENWGNSHMKGYKRGGGIGDGRGKPGKGVNTGGGKPEGKGSLADKAGRDGAGIGVGRTPIQHSGNKNDTQNIGRGPVITKSTGGPIYSDGRWEKDMGPDLPSGNSGVGRKAKAHMAKAGNWPHRGQ